MVIAFLDLLDVEFNIQQSYHVFHLSLALFVFSGSSHSLSNLVLLLFSCFLSLCFSPNDLARRKQAQFASNVSP